MVAAGKTKRLILRLARTHFEEGCVMPCSEWCAVKSDGYNSCVASGLGRCKLGGNGGCWQENRNGISFTACVDNKDGICTCPSGFKGDGVKNCEDIDECMEKKACRCPECSCKNTWGSYKCTCSDDLLYIRDHDTLHKLVHS